MVGDHAARRRQDAGRHRGGPAARAADRGVLAQHRDPGSVGAHLGRVRRTARRHPARPAHLVHRADLPVARGLPGRRGGRALRGHGGSGRAAAPQRARADRDPQGRRTADHRPRRVPPPARGLGPAAARGARRPARGRRARPHRDPARLADPHPGRADAHPVRADPLRGADPGAGQGGHARAVRRARLADRAHRRRGRLAARAVDPVPGADHRPLRPHLRVDAAPGVAGPAVREAGRPTAPRRGRRSPRASRRSPTRRCAWSTPGSWSCRSGRSSTSSTASRRWPRTGGCSWTTGC